MIFPSTSIGQACPLDPALSLVFIGHILASFKQRRNAMQNNPLAAGSPIEANCTKCRKNTDHIIITMAEEEPVKVQCQSCSRQHKYRPPKVTKTRAELLTIYQQDAERKEWETLRPSMNSAKATAYSMTATYKVGALINHPLFGLGHVQRLAGMRKVEVLFEDGKKTMRCK